MAISLIGGSTAAATTITIPGTYAVGDLLLMFSFNNANTTAITVPAGWTIIASSSANVCAYRLCWKLAVSASDTSGTWTNATGLVCSVYRGVTTNKTPIGNTSVGNGSSSTLTYTALTGNQNMKDVGGKSWVAGFGGHVSATNVDVAPSGMTLECGTAVTSLAGSDTNGGVTGWNAQTVGVNASAGWFTITVEILPDHITTNNYLFMRAEDNGNAVLSFSERVR